MFIAGGLKFVKNSSASGSEDNYLDVIVRIVGSAIWYSEFLLVIHPSGSVCVKQIGEK